MSLLLSILIIILIFIAFELFKLIELLKKRASSNLFSKSHLISKYDPNEPDKLYNKAVEIVRKEKIANAAFLQRSLSIGYARAVRILDQMETNGIVGSSRGSKPRKVLKKGKVHQLVNKRV